MELLLSIVSLILIALSLVFITKESRSFSSTIAATLFLLLTLGSCSGFGLFYPAILLSVWGVYVYSKEAPFTASLLISVASLLYPPFIWWMPLQLLLLMLFGEGDLARRAVKSLGGWIVPYLYMAAYHFVFKDDLQIFLLNHWHSISTVKLPQFDFSIADLALIFFGIFVLLHIFTTILRSYIERPDRVFIRLTFVTLLFALVVYFLFSAEQSIASRVLIALPFSLLFAFHYKNGKKKNVKAELILMLLLAILSFIESYI